MENAIPNYGKPNSGFDPLLWKAKTVGEEGKPLGKRKKEHPMVKFMSGSTNSLAVD